MNYTTYLISNKPQFFGPIQNSISTEKLEYFDGTGIGSFSKLVNSCVASSPTETVILMSDKVMPTAAHIKKALSLSANGFSFVGLYSFAFFCIRKELFRKIGMLDERFSSGGFEDYDFILRTREANLSIYNTQEVPYTAAPSSWNYAASYEYWPKKWRHTWEEGNPIPVQFERMLPEEKYKYDLGPSVPTTFLLGEQNSVISPNPHVSPLYLQPLLPLKR